VDIIGVLLLNRHIMAKRFTDTDKWKDVWYSNLSNDNKVIWSFILDTCDNAGIFKLNLKLINFNCSTNISVEEFLSIFSARITQIDSESWYINKFCSFQYGNNFLTSKNKAVTSAVEKLLHHQLIDYASGIYTLSIGSKIK
jgi:hypothetical protein